MAINFSNINRGIIRIPNKQYLKAKPTLGKPTSKPTLGIPTSNQLIGIELRLSKVYIKDNKRTNIGRFSLKSNLYFMIATIDSLKGEPYTLSVNGFAGIDDNQDLLVNRTIYYWKPQKKGEIAPGQIHFLGSIIKSNEKIRDFGNALSELKKTDDYNNIMKTVFDTVTMGKINLIEDTLKSLAIVIGSVLKNVDDDPLITTVQSFTDIKGDMDQLGEHVYPIGNRYVNLETTLIIRDVTRDPK